MSAANPPPQPIRLLGDPILRQKSEEVEEFDSSVEDIARLLIPTLKASGGAAVAAPQIGCSKRIFVWAGGVTVNPTITSESLDRWNYAEGCLSLPNLWWYIDRPKTITVDFFDVKGNKHTDEFSEFDARVFQHEIDHFDGVLVIDHLNKSLRKQAIKKLAKRGLIET